MRIIEYKMTRLSNPVLDVATLTFFDNAIEGTRQAYYRRETFICGELTPRQVFGGDVLTIRNAFNKIIALKMQGFKIPMSLVCEM